MKNLIKLLASGFCTSFRKDILPFPGTRGTVPAWLIAYFLVRGDLFWTIGLAVGFILLSVYLAGKAEQYWGHDAKEIVIDEWAGMFISLILIPYSLLNYAAAFLVFRMTDTFKIPPARNAEKLPGGWGVTADDVIAGIQANLLTQLFVYIINSHV